MRVAEHFSKLGALPLSTVTDDLALDVAFEKAIALIKAAKRCYIIGNGGSASIASHMAEDYTKNGGIQMMAFNDAALLTCFANDFGYEYVFKAAVDYYLDDDDLLIAISSSGKSPNIINAVGAAKCPKITLSGFSPDNPLREMGDVNFYVPSGSYGNVEITHLAILHAMLDFICEDGK